ncbi:MAG: cation-translocating P-type ATPase [Candidatus Obscuribacterales bacterium]|nr:cation-translocating P-type ATPase [Candidatus Obscuribacterales bacterium]
MDWHTLNVDQALRELDSDPERGLNQGQVAERLNQYGFNQLAEKGGTSIFALIAEQFINALVLMLIGAALVAFFSGDAKGVIAIAVIVILNAAIGIWQNRSAESKMLALKKMSAPNARVLREGKAVEIASRMLVPGDILLLETGDKVPGDARVISAVNLRLQESQLTGETLSVEKNTAPIERQNVQAGDQRNMVFGGTAVTGGRGTAVVTATGMNTQFGRIAQLTDEVEEEDTPLQARMEQLGKALVYGSLVVVIVVVVIGVLLGADFKELALTAASMAVAIVPEALPAILTITLALGAQRMVRRNALPRGLKAVATLGGIEVIGSDKTGTLTKNEMVVKVVQTASAQYEVTGIGYDAKDGRILKGGNPVETVDSDLSMLLVAAVAANNATITIEDGVHKVIGDPTEGALIAFAAKANVVSEALSELLPRLGEAPFESARRRMSVIVANKEGLLDKNVPFALFSKGAPETILSLCRGAYLNGKVVPVEAVSEAALRVNSELASQGMRVLALAYRPLDAAPALGHEADSEEGLIWLGMVGIIDPPRPEVKANVEIFREAGVRTVMITGDHHRTAHFIARAISIAYPGFDNVVTGAELDEMSDEELAEVVQYTNVFARVSPEHKLRIVRALQSHELYVAMTGDGVNDAPALKQANIGIAMGSGTDVAKEASNMILTDDNFASIVNATEEGRTIFSNVRKYVKYILASNIGELITLAVAPIFGLRIPLIPVQILYMNLVTDGLPALALGIDPKEGDVMREKPMGQKESVFARGLGAYIMRIGLVFGAISVGFMLFANHVAPDVVLPDGTVQAGAWSSMVFTMLCLSQMWHALTCRGTRDSIFKLGLTTNPWLLVTVVVSSLLQLLLLYVQPLADFFGLQALNIEQLLICFAGSLLIFIYVELEKLVQRSRQRRQAASVNSD